MGQQRFLFAFSFILLLCLAATSAVAQSPYAPAPEPERAEEAAARVRALHYMRDYEGGQIEGARFLERFPEAHELKAWTLLNTARHGAAEEAVRAAEAMVASDPESPWSHFALAGALNGHDERGEEAFAASEKALSMQPAHPDFLWLRAEVLSSQERREEAVAFVEEHRGTIPHPAELLVVKGYALYVLSRSSGREHDEATFEEALRAYEEARALDSTNVNAHYLPGFQLMNARRMAEAYPLLKRAAALSPATRIHQYYWRTLTGLEDRTAEEKQAEIEADIDGLLEARGTSPGLLLAIAQQYGELKLGNEKTALEEHILREHPESLEAEWVLVGRYRDFAWEHGEQFAEDPELKRTYQQMLQDFIDRPHHARENLLGDAYRELFLVAKDDSSFSDDALLEIVQGMVEYEGINPHITYAGGAKALAERKAHFREAEHIAWQGIEEGRKKIEKQRTYYDTEGEYEQALNRMTSQMYDALGWVYFNEGRLEEAEAELRRAYDLHPENMDNLYHLGRLYEQKGELEEAEAHYIKGAMLSTPGTNPNEEALQELYEKRHGHLEGFADYRARLSEIDRERRKKEVLESRTEDAEAARPFELKTLEGEVFSSEALDGKLAVINFWGVWCGWCVKEMPEYQKLYEKYADDPAVVILTINNDTNVEEVRAWMQEHAYTFPVLRDDGYVSQAGVFAFPTTWFLDGQGRKAFEKRGWSEKLEEEFSWRVEALREER